MILVWPLLLVAAGSIAWRRRGAPGGRGPTWFLAWSAAGLLMSFSFVTGLSIGLLLLPGAAGVLLWVARRSPHAREAAGFVAGLSATAILVAIVAA